MGDDSVAHRTARQVGEPWIVLAKLLLKVDVSSPVAKEVCNLPSGPHFANERRYVVGHHGFHEGLKLLRLPLDRLHLHAEERRLLREVGKVGVDIRGDRSWFRTRGKGFPGRSHILFVHSIERLHTLALGESCPTFSSGALILEFDMVLQLQAVFPCPPSIVLSRRACR